MPGLRPVSFCFPCEQSLGRGAEEQPWECPWEDDDQKASCEWPSPDSPRCLPLGMGSPFLSVLSPESPSPALLSTAVNTVSPKAVVAIPRQAEVWPVPSQLFNNQHLLGSPVRVSGSPWNAFWAENQIILEVTRTFWDISCHRSMVELHKKYWFPFITTS